MKEKSPRKKRATKTTEPHSRKTKKQDIAKELEESMGDPFKVANPIKKLIKIKQFPWTERQKEFFRVALHPHTNIVFVKYKASYAFNFIIFVISFYGNLKTLINFGIIQF